MEYVQHHAQECERIHALARLLADDAIDAALQAGLMALCIDPGCNACAEDAQRVLAEQTRLQRNWAARERYRARTARVQRRAAEHQAKRTPAPAPAAAQATPAPALPPAVAAALARAKARAAGRPQS